MQSEYFNILYPVGIAICEETFQIKNGLHGLITNKEETLKKRHKVVILFSYSIILFYFSIQAFHDLSAAKGNV